MTPVRIGTAGWTIPRAVAHRFPAGGSGLTRYAARFDALEINTSFYRSHRADTWRRWAATTPSGFRFAVKVPRAITHERRLVGAGDLIAPFLAEARLLGDKLGPLLVQLPPSLAFDAAVADGFLAALRAQFDGGVAVEPRHPTWFGAEAEALLVRHRVARAAADPASAPEAGQPGGWPGLVYVRLHGSPRMYRTPYGAERLEAWAALLRQVSAAERWCIFDNTASGAAAADALILTELLGGA